MLQELDISKNPINSLSFIKKLKIKNLLILDISSTKIEILKKEIFNFMKSLLKLKMINCKIKNIEKNALFGLENLEILFIENSEFLMNEIYSSILGLKSLKKIIGKSEYSMCCLVWHFIKNEIECHQKLVYFASCDRLIQRNYNRIIFWCFGVFGLLTNIFCILLQITSKGQLRSFKVILSTSNLMLSVYFTLIVGLDAYFYEKEEFLQFLVEWRINSFCQFLGIFATFALLFSASCFMFLIIDVHQAIINPLKPSFLMKHRHGLVILTFFVTLFLASFRLIFNTVNINFFDLFFFSIIHLY